MMSRFRRMVSGNVDESSEVQLLNWFRVILMSFHVLD